MIQLVVGDDIILCLQAISLFVVYLLLIKWVNMYNVNETICHLIYQTNFNANEIDQQLVLPTHNHQEINQRSHRQCRKYIEIISLITICMTLTVQYAAAIRNVEEFGGCIQPGYIHEIKSDIACWGDQPPTDIFLSCPQKIINDTLTGCDVIGY
eukprot:316161_1